MPVLLRCLALDHHNQVVLGGKLLFKLQEILVILLVRPNQVVAAGVELQVVTRVPNSQREQENLGVQEPSGMPANNTGKPAEHACHRVVFGERLDVHRTDTNECSLCGIEGREPFYAFAPSSGNPALEYTSFTSS
ncbi:hypothetical protein SDC9_176309 [bioreactor metagenome]|uniref:Uncharacterized protein n=1 Tax=bioreactor metagenome TaxID=1076179 RepID=A0A645GXV7_9ZZZZ